MKWGGYVSIGANNESEPNFEVFKQRILKTANNKKKWRQLNN